MKKGQHKKAFTLTELLVVVVVIGVLSAVVLPKFNKVIETRRTTEAEELMGAIRTEQEKRCALDKEYATDFNGLSEIVRSDNTKNYTLTLASTGVQAERREKYNYTLSIPSYADGRICCSGADCDKLNKNYPKCEDFTPEASPEACAGEVAETPAVYECMGSATQKCGCQDKGTQSRTCNTSTGEWSDWGACSVSDSCECTGAKQDRRACTASGTCGFETRSAACNTVTGEWEYGSWNSSECQAQPDPEKQVCNTCGEKTANYTCDTSAGTWVLGPYSECSKTEAECEDDCEPYEGEPEECKGVGPGGCQDTCDEEDEKANDKKYEPSVVTERKECYDVYKVREWMEFTPGGLPSANGSEESRTGILQPENGNNQQNEKVGGGGSTPSGAWFNKHYKRRLVLCPGKLS